MPRAKGGYKSRRRRNKVLEKSKGYYGARNNLFTVATEAVDKAMLHAYIDRKLKKREFRSLWIIRINAAARAHGLTYSQFMKGVKDANIGMDRKAIAHMAYHDPGAFGALVDTVRAKIAS